VEMPLQGRFDMLREHPHAVFGAFAIAHDDLIVGKIEVFYPQTKTLHQTQTGTV